MTIEKNVICVTKIGKGPEVGYDTHAYVTGIGTDANGNFCVQLTEHIFGALRLSANGGTSKEMFDALIAMVKEYIHESVCFGRFEGRVKDYKVEIKKIKIEY